MASNIIDFPRAFVSPDQRAARSSVYARKAAAYAEAGVTPHAFGGTDLAAFVALDDELAPRTPEQMRACHLLMHAERLARHLGAEAAHEARAMRRAVAESMA